MADYGDRWRDEPRGRRFSGDEAGYRQRAYEGAPIDQDRGYDRREGSSYDRLGYGPTGDPWANVYGGRLSGRDEFRGGGWSRDPEYRRGNPDIDYGRGYRGHERDDDRGFFEKAGDEVRSWFGDDDAERRRRMDAYEDDRQHHRGRGPKGYTRSDERIREDVNDRLTDDPYLDASDIDVAVAGGEVTLNGTVESRSAKRRAEDLADRVSGVSHVQNNLRARQVTSTTATSAMARASSVGGESKVAGTVASSRRKPV